jgi:O-antigen/teichoic acid export membrane protein
VRISKISKRNRSFLRDIGTLMSAKAIAAVIALLITPIIARLFDPGDFGIAAIWASACALLSHISSLKYELAIMLPADEDEADHLYSLALRILLAFFGIVVVVSVVAAFLPFGNTSAVDQHLWLLWLAPGVLLFGLMNIQEGWLSRRQKFSAIGAAIIAGTSFTGLSRIAWGFLAGSSYAGLIVGQLIGLSARLLVQYWRGGGQALRSAATVSKDALKKVGREYKDFPKLNASASLISSGAKNMPVLLLGFLYGPEPAGFYAMAMRLAQSPLRLVTISIHRVVYQRLAEIAAKERPLVRPYWMLCGGLLLLGIVPTILIVLFGPQIIELLLGPKWPEAGRYLQTVAPWLLMILITVPVSPTLNVIRRQEIWLQLQTASFALRLLVFLVAYMFGAEPLMAIGAFVTAVVCINTCYIVYIGWFLRRQKMPIKVDERDPVDL